MRNRLQGVSRGRWLLLGGALAVGLCCSVGRAVAQPDPNAPNQPNQPNQQNRNRDGMRPPMGMWQTQMVATDDFVYILRGNTLYQYDTTELKLRNKATLEMPEMPPGGPRGEGQPPNPPVQ